MALQARDTQTDDYLKQFTNEEAAAVFDAHARRHLAVSGPDFIRKWRSGDYDERGDDSDVLAVAMLLPLVDEDYQR